VIEAAEVMDSKITIEVVEGMTKDVTTEEVRVVKGKGHKGRAYRYRYSETRRFRTSSLQGLILVIIQDHLTIHFVILYIQSV
jgi:hypothetical protein